MADHLYIAIEGPIGVGKSTLARLIQDEFQARLLMEVFEENPFLSKFYADRAQYAFQTQIFFLLSRYRQQLTVRRLLEEANLISDYTFAKDRLFAQLNLHDDELEMYERLHALLAEQIPLPDLIVYLRADTDVLMERIALRDRSYERGMDREYLEAVNRAYERFYASYTAAPVLPIDTNSLNIVRRSEDLALVVERIKSALGRGTHQRPLLEVTALPTEGRESRIEGRRPFDFRRWPLAPDQEKGFTLDLSFGLLCLQEEIGELASVLRRVMVRQQALQKDGMASAKALASALSENEEDLREELSNCLDCLRKLANLAGFDLESASPDKVKW